MKLIKRVTVDVRNPDVNADNEVNEALIALQTFENGSRNKIEILDIKPAIQDSGMAVFLIMYDDKSLDKAPPKK